jgi:hypothetical protein
VLELFLPAAPSRSALLTMLLPTAIAGFGLSLFAMRRISGKLGAWDDAELASARNWIKSKTVNGVLLALAAVWLVDIVEFFVRNHHMGTAGMITYPFMAIVDLHRQLNPKPAAANEPIWQDIRPIHSNQWGERITL